MQSLSPDCKTLPANCPALMVFSHLITVVYQSLFHIPHLPPPQMATVMGTPDERRFFVQLCHKHPKILAAVQPDFQVLPFSRTEFRRFAAKATGFSISSIRNFTAKQPLAKKSELTPFKLKREERVKRLITVANEHPLAPASRLRAVSGVDCCSRTVRRDLFRSGFRWHIRPKAQRLKDGDPKARLAAAKRLLRANVTQLRFSDEARVTTNETCRRGQWLQKGKRATPLLQEQYAPCFLLWGCVGVGYKRLIILPQRRRRGDDDYERRSGCQVTRTEARF
jgi:hypothetical protein